MSTRSMFTSHPSWQLRNLCTHCQIRGSKQIAPLERNSDKTFLKVRVYVYVRIYVTASRDTIMIMTSYVVWKITSRSFLRKHLDSALSRALKGHHRNCHSRRANEGIIACLARIRAPAPPRPSLQVGKNAKAISHATGSISSTYTCIRFTWFVDYYGKQHFLILCIKGKVCTIITW